jgi:hypothetical protein
MERAWLETIQLLGLDVMVVAVLSMLVLDRLLAVSRWLAGSIRSRVTSGKRPAAVRAVTPPASPADAWPPKEWRPSH